MSIFGPIDSSTLASASKGLKVTGFRSGPRPKPYNPADFADPPEMPEAMKAQGLNGALCYYGFKFPDSAVLAYDEARGIERPNDRDRHSWMSERKHAIMRHHARELGLTLSASIVMLSVYKTGVSGACREDVVYFAFMAQGRLVTSQCPTTAKIKQIMHALMVKGEPYWIVA